MDQLFFRLEPLSPFGLEFYVPHSGTLDALALGRALIERVANGKQRFAELVIDGPKGSGKTHLLSGLEAFALREGLSPEMIVRVDLAVWRETLSPVDLVSKFVATYDALKSSGGLLLVEMAALDLIPELAQHLTSRLRAGAKAELMYPREMELPLIVRSLLERKNLKLPERSVSYLLRRLPSDPCTFDRIVTAVDEAALGKGREVGQKLLGEVLQTDRAEKAEVTSLE